MRILADFGSMQEKPGAGSLATEGKMIRNNCSRVLGCLSIACSLVFWVDGALRVVAWAPQMRLGLATYFVVWLAGLVTAIIAAVIGSRWWLLAIVPPILYLALGILSLR